MTRFLITTALEESWRDDVPVVFLGEWCRLHARRSRWQAMDAQVLPYHWDDREKLHADYRYLRDLYERLLHDAAAALNHFHRVDHGVRYWRILLGPWLAFFIQALYDRWACIQQAAATCDLSETVMLSGFAASAATNDLQEFLTAFVSDEWNHQLYAVLLHRHTDIACRLKEVAPTTSSSVGALVRHRAAWKRGLACAYRWCSARLGREDDAFLMGTYLPPIDEAQLQWRLGQWPQFRRAPEAPRVAADCLHRTWTISGCCRDEFESCARRVAVEFMPTAYLEGYGRLTEIANAMPWPRAPKVVWTTNPYTSDVVNAWIAQKIEQGAPLVIGQHGGHYGMGRWNFSEEHEIAISDSYMSWGWTEPTEPKIVPVGQLKAKRPLGVVHYVQPRALLVTCALPRYSYWMYSVFIAGQYLQYFDDQCRFVAALPEMVRDQLTVRLFPQDFGWDQRARWRERCPGIEFDGGESQMADLMRRSRIYISTYNATTYLESLSMDMPTVMFWNPSHWELRDSALPYFEELKRVGIFHETPESAAAHIAAIWDDVRSWWISDSVRDAVRRFTERYCNVPPDLLPRVGGVLRDVASARGRRVAS